jgi:hypothetical protein
MTATFARPTAFGAGIPALTPRYPQTKEFTAWESAPASSTWTS